VVEPPEPDLLVLLRQLAARLEPVLHNGLGECVDDGTGGGQPRTGHLGETSLARAGRAKGSDVDDVSGAGLRRNPDVEVTSVNGAEAGDKPGAVRKIGAKPVK